MPDDRYSCGVRYTTIVNDGQQVELGWGAWCEDNEIELHVVDEEKSVAIFLDRANVLKLATALIQSVWENLP